MLEKEKWELFFYIKEDEWWFTNGNQTFGGKTEVEALRKAVDWMAEGRPGPGANNSAVL